MKIRILLALAGLSAGSIVPAFTQDEVTPEVRQQLEAVNQKLDEAINKHDPAACAACCTATGVVITPVGTFVGQQEIEKCYTGVFQRFKISNQVDKIAHLYSFGGSDACALVTYSSTAGGGVRAIIYTPEGDTWKIRVMVVKY